MLAARLYDYDPAMNVQLKIEEVARPHDHGARRGDGAGGRRRPVPHRPAHHRGRVEGHHGPARHAPALHHGPRERRLGRGRRQRRQVGQARRRRDLPPAALLRHLPQLPLRRGHALRRTACFPASASTAASREYFAHQRARADQAQPRTSRRSRWRRWPTPASPPTAPRRRRRSCCGPAPTACCSASAGSATSRCSACTRSPAAGSSRSTASRRRRCWPRSSAPTSSSTAAPNVVEEVREITGGGAQVVIDFVGELGVENLVLEDGAQGRPDVSSSAMAARSRCRRVHLVIEEINIGGSLVGNYTELVELMELNADGKVKMHYTQYKLGRHQHRARRLQEPPLRRPRRDRALRRP